MRLVATVDFKELEKYGFEEDPANCEVGDTYYSTNNYYYFIDKKSRIVIYTGDRSLSILTMGNGLVGVHKLNVIYSLIKDGLLILN